MGRVSIRPSGLQRFRRYRNMVAIRLFPAAERQTRSCRCRCQAVGLRSRGREFEAGGVLACPGHVGLLHWTVAESGGLEVKARGTLNSGFKPCTLAMDEKRLLAGGETTTVVCFDLATGQQMWTVPRNTSQLIVNS